tara:strand:+ start:823 stop:981 length:159 start_codon:yes stop_codon:yes gene_type:complete
MKLTKKEILDLKKEFKYDKWRYKSFVSKCFTIENDIYILKDRYKRLTQDKVN